MQKFPRVLILYNSCINLRDSHGVSIRSWFEDWPKTKLAQIYTGGEIGEDTFCEYNFKLGAEERRLGKIFISIKSSSVGKRGLPVISVTKGKLSEISKLGLLRNKFSDFLISTGVWELLFQPVLSDKLNSFVEEFKPDLIYCQGYNLTFAILPILLHKKYSIPICFQTGDDWPQNRYNNPPLGFIMHPFVMHKAKELIQSSEVRLSNGTKMEKLYAERYKVKFQTIMMCDSIDRFKQSAVKRISPPDHYSIIYTGSLGGNRWESIIDLSNAIDILHQKGYNIQITVLASNIPSDAIRHLERLKYLQILPDAIHEELPSYLKGADLLFLPESFDKLESQRIHVSISTKAHLYMFSEKPILVYAPENTGISYYAKQDKWAFLLTRRNITLLANSVEELLLNRELRNNLILRGLAVGKSNHNSSQVKGLFLVALNRAIKNWNYEK